MSVPHTYGTCLYPISTAQVSPDPSIPCHPPANHTWQTPSILTMPRSIQQPTAALFMADRSTTAPRSIQSPSQIAGDCFGPTVGPTFDVGIGSTLQPSCAYQSVRHISGGMPLGTPDCSTIPTDPAGQVDVASLHFADYLVRTHARTHERTNARMQGALTPSIVNASGASYSSYGFLGG